MRNTNKSSSINLGGIYGYNKDDQSIFPLPENVSDQFHRAISKCFNDYAIMYNATASICYISRVLGENLNSIGLHDDMDDNFKLIIKQGKLDESLSIDILEQAYAAAADHFTDDIIRLFKNGDAPEPVDFWHDGHDDLYLPHQSIELISVDIGDVKKFFFCCNFLNPDWAMKYNLSSWVAFEILVSGQDSSNWVPSIFGKVNPLRHKNKRGNFQSKISIMNYQPKGKISLSITSTTDKQRQFVLKSEKQ